MEAGGTPQSFVQVVKVLISTVKIKKVMLLKLFYERLVVLSCIAYIKSKMK